MMCVPCKQAGNMNSYGRTQLAYERHKDCEHSNCVCQHKVGNWTLKKPPRKDTQGLPQTG